MVAPAFLDVLVELNEAERELRRPSLTGKKRLAAEERKASLKAKLPTALVSHHERMLRAGRESVAPLSESLACGGCHMKVPVGLLGELNQTGHIEVCPYCGIFLFRNSVAVAAGVR